MVCCVFLSFLLAGIFWPLRKFIAWFRPIKTPPLMWQLSKVCIKREVSGPLPAPRFSVAARVKSFRYALAGLSYVVRHEHNARIHIAAAMGIVMMGAFYRIAAGDWLILVLAIISVWFAETINTAFEYLCDVVSPEKNEAVRYAKDIAAGAVLIMAIGAVVIGAIVMFPYIKTGLLEPQSSINYAALIASNLCFTP